MANEEQPDTSRPARKSVAFTEEKLVVGADGSVEIMSTPNEEKDTALSHSPSTEPLSETLASTNPSAAPAETETPPPEAGDDGLDLGLMKKKKKKVKIADDAEPAGDDAAAEGDDLGIKKKKKKPKAKEGDDDFAAKLAALDLDKEGGDAAAEEQAQDGDMKVGTGIWKHDDTTPIKYDLLLSRFFSLLSEKNPDHATGAAKSYKIPPPQCMREGNKKTIFANLPEICKRMKRSEEHVTTFLFAELGTSGSTAGTGGLVIKGRFQAKQLENVLRKYIIEYVSCKTCRSPDTELSKGENRLSFVTCNSCGSRRSVAAIKTGFSAQIGKRRKMRA
ncbi:eukaryotic translation initiation factor 2 beta subunit [Diaporthe amygdali]|uniref:eukaryotic translation initiation factor 2 beta subunit n=1 Tax=Phomopsis amygdali TaxID=1214568 RepID=UPI0022FE98B1|nr:eukaryotic translation initiation factor 2 beta subunit [Diaporthe amygdali]KAJ0119118.1 eukaryotic translation initiation factor 2 beta subunit [Diaporthe amygdali]